MSTVSFYLKPRPPFRLDLTVWALRRMPHNEIDRWDGRTYSRVLVLNHEPVKLEISQPGERQILVAVSARTAAAGTKQQIVPLVEKMLGIRQDLGSFQQFASKTRVLRLLAGNFLGFRPPRFPSLYEALINAVACQQISLTVCILLLNRLARVWGRVWIGDNKKIHAFPLASDLAKAEVPGLRALGFSAGKARSVIGISQRVAAGLDLESMQDAPDEEITTALTQLPGIGPWSAEYAMLRGLGRTHIFPGGDSGAQLSLQLLLDLKERPDAARTAKITRAWYPYAGLLYFHFLLNKLRNRGYLAL